LTGDRPFTGSPSTIMQKVLRQDPVEPSVLNPTLSAAWDDLIKRALAKKPDDRLQSARQFADYTRLVAEGKVLPGNAPSGDATVIIDATVRIAPPRSSTSRRGIWAIASAAVVLVVAGAMAWIYRPAAVVPAPPPIVVAPEPQKAAPTTVPEKKQKTVKAEKAAPKPAPPPPAAVVAATPPPAVAAVTPLPSPVPTPARVAEPTRAGKVISLDRTWGFAVIDVPDPGALKIGDRMFAHLAGGQRVTMVVRRISGNLVSAVPEGQKISDDMLGASVTGK
jgi:eukaryotic-like serine/threonine-protein kinase